MKNPMYAALVAIGAVMFVSCEKHESAEQPKPAEAEKPVAMAEKPVAKTEKPAEKAEKPTKEKKGSGFVELFNGKNLDGWTPSKENPDCYTVKDGILIVEGGRGHLFYSGEVNGANFKDFELKVRAKTMPNSNSGVFFHTKYQDEGWPENGYEAQVNTSYKDPKKTGSLYGVENIIVLKEGQKEPKGGKNMIRDKAPSTDGEWFDYHIIVKGSQVEIKVDGKTTVKYTEPEGGPDSNFSGRRLSEGTFAIQAHDADSVVHYERFAVKPL
ncbi:MAG: family 16 glycoside hydrolase [Verrucomicrobiota bacterium]